ncbi:MAG TPA: ABC transporter permease [Bryobacteraceae bacterium]|jgi:putative ABC transport system permease protein|nr:ABC transporter permease [Bryobacteraceae bacterium]
MKIGAIFREAAGALNFNRQRSLLTMASLGWGVACFVILYAYGEGFGFALKSSFQAVGQDLILMFGGQTSTQAGGQRSGRQIRFDLSDVDLIRENVPLVSAISAETMIRNATVLRGVRQLSMSVRAVEPPYGKVRNMTMSEGRWINADDYVNKQRVAILGAKAAHKLFGEIPPVGEAIHVNGIQFQIIGVLKSKTQISNYNTPDNECIFVPLSTASVMVDIKHPQDIVWMPANPVFRKDAVRNVREVLARTHGFAPKDEQALQLFIFNEFQKIIDTMSLALQVLLGLIGALTLAIGGVGLANIMLVSVTQRTREIGVLKSLGATRGTILWQFLVEAMAIVTVGGLLGVLLGWAVTAGIQTLPLLGPLFKDESGNGDIHLHISQFAVITSTVVLEFIGLFAGWLPALKASRMDPIEALRYE